MLRLILFTLIAIVLSQILRIWLDLSGATLFIMSFLIGACAGLAAFAFPERDY